MTMILEQIAADTRLRLEKEKQEISLQQMREKALILPADHTFPFEQMLKNPGIHYICEVKKASPSKGLIAPDFPYLDIAKEYEAAGAGAISCLTEPKYFLGQKQYLKEITAAVHIPVLRTSDLYTAGYKNTEHLYSNLRYTWALRPGGGAR